MSRRDYISEGLWKGSIGCEGLTASSPTDGRWLGDETLVSFDKKTVQVMMEGGQPALPLT